jgi:hypothetical protein
MGHEDVEPPPSCVSRISADRRAARYPHRVEPLSRAARRTCRPRRLVHSLRPDPGGARSSNPRPSIEERYGSGQNYGPEIGAAAAALVNERLLLPADAEVYVETAKACDQF